MTRPPDPYAERRQADELTAEDLDGVRAWWFPPEDGRLTGPDACTVVPVESVACDADGACEFPEGRFLLHAEFRLADGARFAGHVTYARGRPPDAETMEPTLCAPGGQVPLWHGVLVPSPAERERLLALLGRPRGAVFPLTWRATLHPPGTELAGRAEGFLVWRDGRVAAC